MASRAALSKLQPETKSERWIRNRLGMPASKVVVQKGPRITVDLWGFVDIVAIRLPALDDPARAGGMAVPYLHVQATSDSNVAARIRKVLEDDDLRTFARELLFAGHSIEFHGWRTTKLAFRRIRMFRGATPTGLDTIEEEVRVEPSELVA